MQINKILLIGTLTLCSLGNIPAQISPEIQADGRVTFRYYNPEAKHVKLEADLLFADEDSLRYTDKPRKWKMRKDSNGMFSLTTPPLSPETYTYRFRVDGHSLPDPLNPEKVWQVNHQWSVLAVGGTSQSNLYIDSSVHGQLTRHTWYSPTENIERRVLVYTPPGYEYSTDTLPVLYLLHGINSDETSWAGRGRAIQIIDNLIAQEQIQPMLLVQPDCNVGRRATQEIHGALFANLLNYPALCRGVVEDAFASLMDFVNANWRVSHLPEQRAIAGLSAGAMTAANIVAMYPDTFAMVGLFSPVVYRKQVPKANRQSRDEKVVDTQYYVYIGKRDFFYSSGKRFCRRTRRQHGSCECLASHGGHTWRNWRLYLSDYLLKISQ